MKDCIMKLVINITLCFVFLICLVNTVNAGEVSKKVWVDAMSTALPTAFCQSKQFFRQCFEVTQIECEETAMSATRICLKKFKAQIPNVLHQPEDGTHWGTIIGRCAGESYELSLQKMRISNKKCNNPANWQ